MIETFTIIYLNVNSHCLQPQVKQNKGHGPGNQKRNQVQAKLETSLTHVPYVISLSEKPSLPYSELISGAVKHSGMDSACIATLTA